MNKLTMLFIRACKYDHDGTRVKSVYRRFYNNEPTLGPICHILAEICEEFNLYSITHLISKLDPNNPLETWRDDGKEYDYTTRCFNTLRTAIRYSSVDRFPGLISPLRFRQ